MADSPSKSRQNNIPAPEFEGYLLKKGHIRKNWKWRWFKLQFGFLCYFETQDDTIPLGAVDLKHYTVTLYSDPAKGKLHAFALQSSNPSEGMRPFNICAIDEKSLKCWIVGIEKYTIPKAPEASTAPVDRRNSGSNLLGSSAGSKKFITTQIPLSKSAENSPPPKEPLGTTPPKASPAPVTTEPRQKASMSSAPPYRPTRPALTKSNSVPGSPPQRPTQTTPVLQPAEGFFPDVIPELPQRKSADPAIPSQPRPDARCSVLLLDMAIDVAVDSEMDSIMTVSETDELQIEFQGPLPVIDTAAPAPAKDKDSPDTPDTSSGPWKFTKSNPVTPTSSGAPSFIAQRGVDSDKPLQTTSEEARVLKLMDVYVTKDDPHDLYHIAQDQNLGKGSVGEVFFAENKQTGEKVAVKKLHTKKRDQDRLPFILREIEIIATSAHKNIVRYIASYQVQDELWVMMEFMSAGSLYDICKHFAAGIRFSEAGVAYITHEVLEALHYLHALKRIHRDIKVDNVLMSLDGSVKLADFGTAVQLTFQRLRRTTLAGTPYYMAPELIQRIPYNEKVDVWSVGIAVIEMLEGEPPFYEMDPTDAIEMIVETKNIGLSDPSVSPITIDFVNFSCLKKNPEERLSVAQLLDHPFMKMADTKENFAKFLKNVYHPEPTAKAKQNKPVANPCSIQ